jgi:hypothetical protein
MTPKPTLVENLVCGSCFRRTSRTTLHTNCSQSVLISNRRRQISPLDGRALELLGHAIEYLEDEVAFRADNLAPLCAEDPQIRSIQILIAASQSVYYDCPIAPTIRERLCRFLFRRNQITAAS